MKRITLIALMLSAVTSHAHQAEINPEAPKFDLNLKHLERYYCKHADTGMLYKSCIRLIDRCTKDRVYRYGSSGQYNPKIVVRAFNLCKEDY